MTTPPTFTPPKLISGRIYNAYQVFIPSDTSEGRGPMLAGEVHWTQEGANLDAVGKGVQGSNAEVRPVRLIADEKKGQFYLLGPPVNVQEPSGEALLRESIAKKAAKAGFTDEEKKLLGIS